MAQQGHSPGRHSRGSHPGDAPYDAPYGEETPYRDEAQYRDEARYRDEVPYPEAQHRDQAPYGEALYREEAPYREAPYRDDVPPPEYQPQPDRGLRPDGGRPDGGRPGRGRPDRGLRPRGERNDPSRRADRQRPGREAWQQADPFSAGSDTDANLPPWAGPAIYPGRPTGTLRRPALPHRREEMDYREPIGDADPRTEQGGDSHEEDTRSGRRRGRAAATRLRKSRRRVYRWGGIAIAACVVAAGTIAIMTHHGPKPLPYVTSLQHGEFTSVPSACTAVGTSVLSQFLPGPGRTSTSTITGSTNSQCSFTVDSKPNFLVLEVQAQSYQPFAAAASNGSATGNAADNFALTQLNLAHPPKKSALPPAQITKVTGLGQQAFAAFQTAHVTGIVTDVATVVIRERNVVITVSLSGQESGHGFGPVPASTLEAGARAAAQAVLTKVMSEPTA